MGRWNYDLLMEQWLIWPVVRPANKTLAIRWVRHLGMDDKIPRAKTQGSCARSPTVHHDVGGRTGRARANPRHRSLRSLRRVDQRRPDQAAGSQLRDAAVVH